MKLILAIVLPIVIVTGGVAALFLTGTIGGARRPAKRALPAVARPLPRPAAVESPRAAESPRVIAPARISAPVVASRIRYSANTRPAAVPDGDPESERKLARLASVYEQMPSEDAARIMATLPDPLVASLMRRIDERQVGKILLALGPRRASQLTLALAR